MRGSKLLAAGNSSERRASAAVMPPLVFLGPSLKRAEAALLIAAEFRPPACRGDIYRGLLDGYTTIVLIDGEFHGHPSVWQREIVDALVEGAVVHGASSMGALRAAELHSLGMAGHGQIFAWYRDGVIDGDDEVALTYGPAELDYPALSEPLVNIRATLAAAVPEIITAEEQTMLLESVRRLYFPDRSFAALLDASPATKWPAVRRDALSRFLVEQRIDQKRLDAIAVLTTIASGAGGTRECVQTPHRRRIGIDESDSLPKVLPLAWRRSTLPPSHGGPASPTISYKSCDRLCRHSSLLANGHALEESSLRLTISLSSAPGFRPPARLAVSRQHLQNGLSARRPCVPSRQGATSTAKPLDAPSFSNGRAKMVSSAPASVVRNWLIGWSK